MLQILNRNTAGYEAALGQVLESPPNPLGRIINHPLGGPNFGDGTTNFGTPMQEYRPPAFQHPLVAPQQIYPLSTPPVKNGNGNRQR